MAVRGWEKMVPGRSRKLSGQKRCSSGWAERFCLFIVYAMSVMLLSIGSLSGFTMVTASASEPESGFAGRVQDGAALLSPDEAERLESACKEAAAKHGMGVYIITTDDFGGGDIKNWQRRIFEEYGYYKDCKGNGVMLAVSMAERDWGLVSFGAAQEAFSTYGRERIGELILDDLSAGEYYDAFSAYVSMADDYYTALEEGKPYTESHRYREGRRIVMIIGASFLMSLVVSLLIVFTWKKSMNTRILQDGAMAYLKPGSFRLTHRSDRFLYHTTSRTKRQKQSSSGGSGGMSSDHSGTSGKF